jgi:uncharacterized integral membrane protein
MCVENWFILVYMSTVLAGVLLLASLMKFREVTARRKYLKEIR